MGWWERLTSKPTVAGDGECSKTKPEEGAPIELDEVTLPPGTTANTEEQKPMTTTTQNPATAGTLLVAEQHPVLTSALAAGVTTPEQFAALRVRAANGDAYAKEVGETLTAQGIRLFGQEAGARHARAMSHLPIDEQKSVAHSWETQADAKFGIAKDGTPASRTTAPAALAQSVHAESTDGGAPVKAWDKITDDQRVHGAKMGMNTDAKRESFANQLLKGAK